MALDKDTTAILDMAYPEVDKALSNSANINRWKMFMSKFLQKRQQQLYSNMPSQQMYYSADDVAEWFRSTGISRRVVTDAIKQTYYNRMANFNPSYAKDESTIGLLCMVKFFKEKKMDKELALSLINISFSGKFYPSIFYGSFKFPPAEHVMEYVVNYMLNNKFELVKQGTVVGAVRSISETWVGSYDDRFEDFHDEDCCYLVQQLHNRIGSFIQNIAELYYKAYEDRNNLTYDSDSEDEDDYHIADNDSYKINAAVSKAMADITQKGVDYVNCKRASNDNVKFNELKSIIENILSSDENLTLVKEYLELLVTLYFNASTTKDVKDLSFISFSIKPVPNSKDKLVLRKKEIMDILLLNNSENFAIRRSRAATESAYYRAINAYFALTIQKASKK